MLATVPIGRMSMQCWRKGESYRTGITGSCKATDAYREMYIEASRLAGTDHLIVAFIYFHEIGHDQMDYIQCEGLRIDKSTKEKKRGESLVGMCNRYLHSYQDASLKLQTLANDWTTQPGLEKRIDRDEMTEIFEVLKR